MKNTIKLALAISLSTIAGASLVSLNFANKQATAFAYYTNGDADTYYDGIGDKEGNDLLAALTELNKSKRKSTVGYGSMGTDPSGMFKYTDYDPDSVVYDSNGQPYGRKCISFYSGNPTTGWNREHVWPDSHGGNKVENDIHMPRPTIEEENGSRGNSFYVEGMKDGSKGWDPAMESFGKEDYRGDSARIIFYCAIADTRLTIIDSSYHSTSRKNNDDMMGKLSDMLAWNLKYPVQQREQNRNEGAEYLQGNRNPFIDHPEYACKIWGNTNEETRKICGTKVVPPTKIDVAISNSSVAVGEFVNATVKVNEGASSMVTWSSSDNTVAKIDSTGKITGLKEGTATITATSTVDPTVKGNAIINVKAVKSIEMSGTASKLTYEAGQGFDPAGLTINAIYSDGSKVNVTSQVKWEPSKLYEGLTKVTGKYAGFSVTVEGITVTPGTGGYTLVESESELANGDKVIIANTSAKITASTISNSVFGKVSSTFSEDKKKITEVGEGTTEFVVNKSGSEWTFTTDEGNLASTSEKKMSYVAGNSTWKLTFNAGTCKMTPSGATYSLQYNSSSPRFTTYKSSQQPIALFRAGAASDDSIHVESVTLNKTAITLNKNGTETLTATVLPANATNKSVTWESSDESVVTVANGVITAVNGGTAIITAMSVDGEITATCNVTVSAPKLTSIAVSGANTSFKVGDSFAFGGTVTATYEDNTTNVVTTLATITGYDLSKAGKQTLTVSYTENGITKTTTYQIDVTSNGGGTGGNTDDDDGGKTVTPAGCQGSIVAGSAIVSLISLAGLGLMIARKKHN